MGVAGVASTLEGDGKGRKNWLDGELCTTRVVASLVRKERITRAFTVHIVIPSRGMAVPEIQTTGCLGAPEPLVGVHVAPDVVSLLDRSGGRRIKIISPPMSGASANFMGGWVGSLRRPFLRPG